MRLEFTYTFDDLKEALVPEKYAANPGAYRGASISGLLAWPLLFLMIAASLWMQELSPVRPRPAELPARELALDLLPSVLPAALVFLLLAIATWRTYRRSWQGPTLTVTSGRKWAQQVVGVLIMLIVALGTLALLNRDWEIVWQPTRNQLLLLEIVPWMINLMLLVLLGQLQRRWSARQQWASKPGWQRPKVLELDAAGFSLLDPVSRVQHAWPYFRRARETANLIVLISEDGLQYLIPKRAFADPLDADRARGLIQNMVPQSSFLSKPGGFAVIPKPAIPLPMGAVERAGPAPLDAVGHSGDHPADL